jgi:hypothetical protein
MAPAQVPTRQAARVAYEPPSGSELTVNEITAFVSLPETVLPGQKLYITVTGPVPAKREVAATPGCQSVSVSFPQDGNYEVAIETELPRLSDAAGKCQGGSSDSAKFVVKVAAKAPVASPTSVPGAPKAPASAGRGRAAATGGKAGGASIAGIDVARFEADFDRLMGKAGSAPADEEGFESELRYTEPGERDEELGTDEESGTRRNTLGFIAGGLLALVTFLWLRCLRSEVDRRPLPG